MCASINLPAGIIFCGGFGNMEHIKELEDIHYDAIALASTLHYELLDIEDIKQLL